MRQKKIAQHDYDDCTIIIVPDHPTRRGCQDCVLNQTTCKSLCLLEGTRYHIASMERYGKLRTIYRRIKKLLLSHY